MPTGSHVLALTPIPVPGSLTNPHVSVTIGPLSRTAGAAISLFVPSLIGVYLVVMSGQWGRTVRFSCDAQNAPDRLYKWHQWCYTDSND